MGIGILGLVKAVNTFDPSKSSKFSNYVGRRIENQILMSFRKDKSSTMVSIDEVLSSNDEDNQLLFKDVLSEDDVVGK